MEAIGSSSGQCKTIALYAPGLSGRRNPADVETEKMGLGMAAAENERSAYSPYLLLTGCRKAATMRSAIYALGFGAHALLVPPRATRVESTRSDPTFYLTAQNRSFHPVLRQGAVGVLALGFLLGLAACGPASSRLPAKTQASQGLSWPMQH